MPVIIVSISNVVYINALLEPSFNFASKYCDHSSSTQCFMIDVSIVSAGGVKVLLIYNVKLYLYSTM